MFNVAEQRYFNNMTRIAMRKGLIVAAAALSCLAAASQAFAEGGCGIGWHRGPYGGCRRNDVIVEHPAVVVATPGGRVIFAPLGRACPIGYHLGPQGRRCWPN